MNNERVEKGGLAIDAVDPYRKDDVLRCEECGMRAERDDLTYDKRGRRLCAKCHTHAESAKSALAVRGAGKRLCPKCKQVMDGPEYVEEYGNDSILAPRAFFVDMVLKEYVYSCPRCVSHVAIGNKTVVGSLASIVSVSLAVAVVFARMIGLVNVGTLLGSLVMLAALIAMFAYRYYQRARYPLVEVSASASRKMAESLPRGVDRVRVANSAEVPSSPVLSGESPAASVENASVCGQYDGNDDESSFDAVGVMKGSG